MCVSKKEEFKQFVRNNPNLLKHVQSGKMSWQKFYEMYDLYGENNDVWKEYLVPKAIASFDFMELLKGIDLDSIQNGVASIQRVVGLLQDMGNNKNEKQENRPRPIYKHFED